MKHRMGRGGRWGVGVFAGAFLFAGAAVGESRAGCDVGRDIVRKDGKTYYVVHERAATLYMISRDLYGGDQAWKKIAEWNGLKAPYSIRLGTPLLLKAEPKLTESEGTESLITAWTALAKRGKYPETAKTRIAALEACREPEPAANPEPVAAAVPAPSPTPIPFVPPAVVEPTAPSVALPPPQTPPDAVPGAAASEKYAATESHGEEHEDWNVSAAVTGSLYALELEDEEHETKTKVDSRLNYGIALGIERHLSEKWSLGVGASLERIRMKAVEDEEGEEVGVLENPERNLFGVSFELEYEVAEAFALSIGGSYVQRPFVAESVVHGVYLPEAALGARVRLFETSQVRGWLVGEGMYAFKTTADDFELKADKGYQAGLRFDFKLGDSWLVFSPQYRAIKVGVEGLETKQKAFVGELGMRW